MRMNRWNNEYFVDSILGQQLELANQIIRPFCQQQKRVFNRRRLSFSSLATVFSSSDAVSSHDWFE